MGKKIMKKLIIIAAASFFIFTSCSKVDTTPDSQRTNVSQVKQQSQIVQAPGDTHCFTITNLETNKGKAEYRVQYIDCYGNIKNVPLPAGQYLSDCLQYTTVRTNFAYVIIACR